MSRVDGITKMGTAHTYLYICARGAMASAVGLGSSAYCVFRIDKFVFFVLRVGIVLMLSCFRSGGRCVCGGCIAGFVPKQSRLLDAPVASSSGCLLSSFVIWNHVPSNNVRTRFGLLNFCCCCCSVPTRTMKCLQPTSRPASNIVH